MWYGDMGKMSEMYQWGLMDCRRLYRSTRKSETVILSIRRFPIGIAEAG